jgi:chromate reductase
MNSTPRVSGTILAISGSLRRRSINSAVLRAVTAAAAQDGALVVIDDSVRELPHFDPDLDIEPPEAVVRFRAACEEAAGVLLAVPEYTFGIPGSFKNALDWTVRSGSLYGKPITVVDVAPPGRAAHVREALDLVLRAHGADVARYSMPVARSDRNAAGEVDDPRIIGELRAVVAELAKRSSVAHAAPRGAAPSPHLHQGVNDGDSIAAA